MPATSQQALPIKMPLIDVNSDQSAQILSRFIMPLGIKPSSAYLPWDRGFYATFTLIKVRDRHIFVTCWHVLEKLRTLQKDDNSAEVVAYLSGASAFAELSQFKLLDHDQKSLDIAVFSGASDDVYLPTRSFIDYPTDYARDVSPGDPIVIIGYPAANISISQENTLFGYAYFCLTASSVSERQIVIADEDNSRSFIDYAIPARPSISLGGMSGCPAFLIKNNRCLFAGILKDGSTSEGTILVSRLPCLKDDGCLDHLAIAW